jgi:hypothetical protein
MRILLNKFCQAGRGAIVLALVSVCLGCAGAGEGAMKGAAGGALAGAASGLVSSLIWGGDPAYHMARGATYGATVGAVGGAIEGSSRAKAENQNQALQEQRELDQIRRDIGDDSFDAIVALAECKHEVAIASARVGAESKNGNHALAGLWVQALTYADQGDQAKVEAVAPEIVRWDREVENESQFDIELIGALEDLKDIRSEYALPRTCST